MEANGSVILVSFGVKEGAQKWLEETKSSFRMVIDIERHLYTAFGLQRSVFKVWGVGSMVYYAEKMSQGVPLPKPYENIHDDHIQMGGDFIVDKNGIVRLIYSSKTSSDRPEIQTLITGLRNCGDKEKD